MTLIDLAHLMKSRPDGRQNGTKKPLTLIKGILHQSDDSLQFRYIRPVLRRYYSVSYHIQQSGQVIFDQSESLQAPCARSINVIYKNSLRSIFYSL